MTEMRTGPDLLRVRGLRVDHFDARTGATRALLTGVDLDVAAGEAVALVGPSGCGKSLLARALLGLLPAGFGWRGELAWRGIALDDPEGAVWRRARGTGMGLILQEPLTSLNPVLTAGEQIAEALRHHRGLDRAQARREAVALLAETQVQWPERIADSYAHQLSGGLRQRVLLAAALACEPDLLIADEPTTALDTLAQREIIALIARLRRVRGMALLFITHDQNLVPLVADTVAFMAQGRIDRLVPVDRLSRPAEPFARVRTGSGGDRDAAEPVLAARGLVVRYPGRSRPAVAGVDLSLERGRASGILGESGSGKTSLGRALAGHVRPTGGALRLGGADCPATDRRQRRRQRRSVQMLFQDPGGSLDPRQRVGAALQEAMGAEPGPVAGLLAEVGLEADVSERYPHQLSGGQRQRVALARALAPAPTVLVADEPTSALDAAARDRILQLLARIMTQRGLALLIISHELPVLQGICDQIHVMYGGLLVETLPGGPEFRPRHPYTRQLQAAVPGAPPADLYPAGEPGWTPAGETVATSAGCPLYGRCSIQKIFCGKELPPLKQVGPGHWLRCPEAETAGPSHFIDTI